MPKQLELWDKRGAPASLPNLTKITQVKKEVVDGGIRVEYGLKKERLVCSMTPSGEKMEFTVADKFSKEPVFAGTVRSMDAFEAGFVVNKRGFNEKNTAGLSLTMHAAIVSDDVMRLSARILRDVSAEAGKKHLAAGYEEMEYRQPDARSVFLGHEKMRFKEVCRVVSRTTDEGDRVVFLK